MREAGDRPVSRALWMKSFERQLGERHQPGAVLSGLRQREEPTGDVLIAIGRGMLLDECDAMQAP